MKIGAADRKQEPALLTVKDACELHPMALDDAMGVQPVGKL